MSHSELTLLEWHNEQGPNASPGHLFPISETWFIKLKKNNQIQNIHIESVNPQGQLYVARIKTITVNGEVLHPNKYTTLDRDLRAVKLFITPLRMAALNQPD